MINISINADGDIPVTENGYTLESAIVVHAPAVISGTIAVGYLDSTETFIPYLDGGLAAGNSKVYNTGAGANVVAQVAGVGTPYVLQAANFRSR